MAIVVSASDPRGPEAVRLALQADTWQSVGRAWRIPSRSRAGLTYVVTTASCTCPDHRFNARCAHSLAVQLQNALRDEVAAF